MSRRAALEQVLALSRLCADGAKRTVVANPAGSTRLPFLQNQLRAVVMPAQESSEDESLPREVLRTRVDDFGGVSVISEGESDAPPRSYRNVDGQRLEDGRYAAFMDEISSFVPKARQFTDAVRTFAYGTDASFYRLNPKLVVKVHTEDEIARILPIAHKHQVPVTFRAAGTSLSGQAITDSVLLKLSHTGKNWRAHHVHGDGSEITVQPGLIGGEVNKILLGHKNKHQHEVQYKIGPDPSSIDSCMVGGMVSNNSSGMCCGVSQNTYHTLKDMRIVFLDGTVLDTADEASRAAFKQSHADLLNKVSALAERVQEDGGLSALIRRKFSIKCTTGYSLNALVDFPTDEPIEIVKRLMIGSEGTLGFVSQATYNTVPEWPHKASAFIMFPDVFSACQGASVLRDDTSVDAVEIFDRAALRECAKDEGMARLVPDIGNADSMAAGLLVECRGQTPEALEERILEVMGSMKAAGLPFGARKDTPQDMEFYPFKREAKDYGVYWDTRKGLIPIVGGARETGTSMLIEDVACPVENLGAMTMDLVEMFQKYGYHDASCFGHALEGNLHLVFSQGFRTAEEVDRFGQLMDELCYIVATKHSGSLKGEHGTGRNVAPYVEMEWGTKAYDLMWEIKEMFDPDYVLNPGVVLNRDPDLHLKHLKQSPPTHELIDNCIECGFCESNCPSKDVTLTPRQRITTLREQARLKAMPSLTAGQQARLDELEEVYKYQGSQTCAADGMCQVKCPVKINTGEMIKELRAQQYDDGTASKYARSIANNFGTVASVVPNFLNIVDFAHRVVGPKPLQFLSEQLMKLPGHIMPLWTPHMPRGASKLQQPLPPQQVHEGVERKVVYLPTCVTRMMGPSLNDPERASTHEKLLSLFNKADYEVVYPEGLSSSCCGMMFNSRGFKTVAADKGAELEKALVKASEGGKYPIVCDTSPCLATIKGQLQDSSLKFALYEPIEFISTFLQDKLEWRKVKDTVAIHVPCSSKKMGVENAFAKVAGMCAHEVVPSGIPCCGMAGDRGMRYPELTGAALQHLNLPQNCKDGYSSSRTCEISLSNQAKVPFRGLVYLADEASSRKASKAAEATA